MEAGRHIARDMRVFIANFGPENYLWPTCLKRSTITTFESMDLRPFSLSGDRTGFVAQCIATKKTQAGNAPTPSVASRWFNLVSIISETEGDVWIHRAKSELWWTTSRTGSLDVSVQSAFRPTAGEERVYELHKPADAWSGKNKRGAPLLWDALHPKAKTFLFTEATFQQLASGNADYALALLEGGDLGAWHRRPEWKAAEVRAGRGAATVFDARRRTVVRMAITAMETVANANGQQVLRTVRLKELRFPSRQALEDHIAALLRDQEGLCAVTGISLQFDGEDADPELLCSLDRIDSDGHYEAGNLQVVCRFVNRWKGDRGDPEFRRLIDMVRNVDK